VLILTELAGTGLASTRLLPIEIKNKKGTKVAKKS
jgi:hypothetical protein